MPSRNYDIIGDIHGHVDALKALLSDLGYHERASAWRHPDRQVIFVGDYIDRGPKQIGTVDIVRAMVDEGSAQAVMGNHELNAIAWFLPDRDQPDDYLHSHYSPRDGKKHYLQHKAFLDEVEGTQLHDLEPTIFKAVEALLKGIEIPLPTPHRMCRNLPFTIQSCARSRSE